MALEFGTFAFGSSTLPLTDSTDNDLLQDADPAIYHALAYLSTCFEAYFGARLKAQAALHGLKLPGAVVETASVEPLPFLLNDQFKFPLFCLYRKKDVWDEHTIAYDKSTSTWEFAYVLPPLTPVQARQLKPILRSVSETLRRVIHRGTDPNYNAGEIVWSTAGIQKARLLECVYDPFARIDTNSQYYAALTGTIAVLEREMPVPGAFDAFDGVDAGASLADPLDQIVEPNVAQIATHAAPTIATITPDAATKAGGTTLTIAGTGFLPLTSTSSVLIGGKKATGLTRINATTLQCVTPAHDAFPSAVVDVVMTNADSQQVTAKAGFTFTTP